MKRILLALVVVLCVRGTPLVRAVEAAGGTPAASQEVLIEAVVLEVGPGAGKGPGHRSEGHELAPGAQAAIVDLSAGGAGTHPRGFDYVWKLNRDLNATVTEFAQDRRVKILQRPRIQTSHAVPATLFVGESRPDPRQASANTGAPGSSRGQIPIGLTLEVNPLIGAGNLITLDLRLRVDRVEKEVVIENVGPVPVTSSREAQTKLALHDRDMVLLGGLTGWKPKAPPTALRFPKEIPGSESLFSRPQDALEPSELIVLIRPTLLAK